MQQGDSVMTTFTNTSTMYHVTRQFKQPEHFKTSCSMYRSKSALADFNTVPAISSSESTTSDPLPNDEELDHLKQRQERLFDQLEQLATKLKQIKDSLQAPNFTGQTTGNSKTNQKTTQNDSTLDVVVYLSPRCKPVSLVIIYGMLQQAGLDTSIAEHVHSSVKTSQERCDLTQRLQQNSQRSGRQLILTIIWKEVSNDLELKVSPLAQGVIAGETNLLRYLSSAFLPSLTFADDPIKATLVDQWLDLAQSSVALGKKNKQQAILQLLDNRLKNNEYVVGHGLSIADIGMLSALLQTSSSTVAFPDNVKKWMRFMCKHENVVRALKVFSYNTY